VAVYPFHHCRRRVPEQPGHHHRVHAALLQPGREGPSQVVGRHGKDAYSSAGGP